MKSKKFFSMIAFVLVMIMVLTACSSDAGTNKTDTAQGQDETGTTQGQDETEVADNEEHEPVTLVYWNTHGEAETPVLNNVIIPAFEEKYPWITVESVTMPTDGLKQQLITAISSGTAPDVMRLDIIWTPEFAKMGALVEVDDLEGYEELADNFFEGPLNTNLYNGKHYGLPNSTNTTFAFYNLALLEKAGFDSLPKTYDELVAAKNKLGEGEYLIGCGGVTCWQLMPYFYSLGGTFTDDAYSTATGYINSEASVKALETLVQWSDEGIMSPALLGGSPDAWGGITGDQVLMMAEGPWFPACTTEEEKDKYAYGDLLPAGSAGSISVVGGENVVMFNNGKHNEEAWLLMKYLSSDEAMIPMAVQGSVVPPTKTAADSEEVLQNPVMAACLQQLETSVARIPNANWEKIDEKINIAFEQVFRHEAGAKETLDKLAGEIDALLAD